MTEADVRNIIGVPDRLIDDPSRPAPAFRTGSCDSVKAVASMIYSFERKYWGVSASGSVFVASLDPSRVVLDTHWEFIEY
jgi:hypothetical protein